MTQIKTVKAGIMPGRISDYAVETGTSIRAVLQLAGLNPDGQEVKVDGVVVTNLDSTFVTESTNAILLAKQVKGNSTVKIGIMPGRISDYALEAGTTIRQALELAGLDPSGHEVKIDGVAKTNLDEVVGSASAILLAKQVKGNSTVKIGMMPGRISDYALEAGTTIRQALELAGLNPDGHEVKVDGVAKTNFDEPVGGASAILLAKQVKGNK